MRFAIPLLALALVALPRAQAAAAEMDGKELLRRCKIDGEKAESKYELYSHGFCVGYVAGLKHALMARSTTFCGHDKTIAEAIEAVRGYITREFARRGEEMRILAVQGLENAFPCQ